MSWFDQSRAQLASTVYKKPAAAAATPSEGPRPSFEPDSFRFNSSAVTGSLFSSLFPQHDEKGVKSTVLSKRAKKKKKEEEEEPPSRSSDNEGDLSFVDHDACDSDSDRKKTPNPFLKRSHYSASRQKRKMRKRQLEQDLDDEVDEDAEVDEAEAEKEEDASIFKRADGKDLEYKSDEFVDLSEEEFRQENERREQMGLDPRRRSPSSVESDEGGLYVDSAPRSSSDDDDGASLEPSSSSSSDLMESDDLPGVDPMDVDQPAKSESEDEASSLLKSAAQFIQVSEHRHAPAKKRRETTRSMKAREAAKELVPLKEIDSEADTVDPQEKDDEDDDDSVNTGDSAVANVHACVEKMFTSLDLVTPGNAPLTTPLEMDDVATLFDVVKTLTAIHLNASVEQQKSKTIQADINRGRSNIPGQSTSVTQSESAQNALRQLNQFTRKDKILALLSRAPENVA